jgi:hypothetical protein
MLMLHAGISGHKHTDGHMLLGVCVEELVIRVFRTFLSPQLIASTFRYGRGGGEGYSPVPTPRPTEISNCLCQIL